MSKAFNEEKKYLEYVKKQLVREMESYQKELREIPKRYTNVLQGDAFLVEGLMTNSATELRKLELSEKSPYFGRIDFLSDGSNDVTKIYIGKTNINNEHNQQVTIDWRTPICSLYYDSDLGEVSYEAPCGIINGELKLKRQIIIQNGELVDALDTSLVSNDELLQPYLSANADNKMKTIIASIQKEQNKIIRRPISENIIVQGVAGSGKTSVALHRIAYLVYNLGEKVKSNQFLVIGPNKYFLNYISSILPELETEPVDQQTYIDLVNECLEEKLTLDDSNIVFNQSDDKTCIKKIQACKASLAYKKALDKFMRNYLENEIVPYGFQINGDEVYSIEMVKNVLFSVANNHPNFESACSYLVKNFKENIESIYSKLNEKYRQIYISLPKGSPERDNAISKSTELNQLIKEKGVKLVRDYFKKIKLKPFDIYKSFIANVDQYIDFLSEKEILELQKSTLLSLMKKKASFDDLPALMHINYLLYGANAKYKHIVIDEAQDYGLFHFNVLKENFPSSTFSIYGDLAQSIYSYKSIENWESVVSNIFDGKCEILNLNKSYRTTIEITNNANKILRQMNLCEANPVIRHGADVNYIELHDNLIEVLGRLIKEYIEKRFSSIAVICKDEKEAKLINSQLKAFGIDALNIAGTDTEYKGGLCTTTSYLAKGLEFDGVIITDASENKYNFSKITDMKLLYVAMTRSLHELNVLYKGKLAKPLQSEVNENSLVLKK
jgi:DNA helicase-2/ATP-dependent DNA helicase PcrA